MATAKKTVKRKRKKYMLVEIDWDIKAIRAAAGAKNISSAKFAQLTIKNAVERYTSKQLTVFSG